MIAIENLQHRTVEILEAWPDLAGVPVIEDVGKSEHDIEAALRSPGHCLIVPLLLDGDKPGHPAEGAGAVLLLVGVMVIVLVNPKKSTINPVLLLKRASKALLEFAGDGRNPNERYRVNAKAFVVDDSDPGAIAYHCFFDKRCVL